MIGRTKPISPVFGNLVPCCDGSVIGLMPNSQGVSHLICTGPGNGRPRHSRLLSVVPIWKRITGMAVEEPVEGKARLWGTSPQSNFQPSREARLH